MKEANLELKLQLQDERKAFEQKKISTKDIYSRKQQYEGGRNNNIVQATEKIVEDHQAAIQAKIESHKQGISFLKADYRNKVKAIKDEFETMVSQEYPSLISGPDSGKERKIRASKKSRRCSLMLEKQKSGNLCL